MSDKKHIIWSNRNLSLDKWEDDLRDHYDVNGLDYDEYDDVDHYGTMTEINHMYLGDERCNLDIQLNNEIIAIADLGLWSGRVQGYKIIESGNIKDCLSTCNDYSEWYVDEQGEFRCIDDHHDGTNFYWYRVFKPGVSDFEKNILTGLIYDGKASDEDIKRYTSRIGPAIGKVYGWKFPGRAADIVAA